MPKKEYIFLFFLKHELSNVSSTDLKYIRLLSLEVGSYTSITVLITKIKKAKKICKKYMANLYVICNV
jgi:hypothetical protein